MTTLKKHVGRLRITDRRCVVVMMQIPGKEDHALVVDTDALPDRFHDALFSVVDSQEGQSVGQLHTLLARRIVPDLNMDMMNALHAGGYFRAVPVDEVIMYPAPHQTLPLRQLIELMGNTVPTTPEQHAELQNRHLENQKVQAANEQIDVAKNLLIQAADLEAAAAAKRAEAFRVAPSLRPDAPAPVEAPAAPVEASVAPEAPAPFNAAEQTATQTAPTGDEVIAERITNALERSVFTVEVDDTDLPPDVAQALQAAMEQANVGPIFLPEDEEPAHAVDTSEDSIQQFLDRAAYREDKANKVFQESLQPKRPVGRPRKDGTPTGSPRAKPSAKKASNAKGSKGAKKAAK